jgi:hypothetical protein
MMKSQSLYRSIIFTLLLAGLVFAQIGDNPLHARRLDIERRMDEIEAELLPLMPDAETNPEAYSEWKASYAEAFSEVYSGRERPTEPMVLSLNNGYVDFKMSEGPSGTGVYSEGCRPSGAGAWLRLTYYYPSTPWDWTIYKIDGNTPIKTYRTGTGTVLSANADSMYILGDKAYTIWNNLGGHGCKVVQILQCVSLGGTPGAIEQVKRTNFIIPIDGSSHNVGCMVYWDTQLNSSDGANIATAFGYTGIATFHTAPSIPPTWRAFENGVPPVTWGIEALGILMGFEATMPDAFWYGNWGSTTGNGWEDAEWIGDSGGGYGGDTAAMVKWNQRTVAPGDTAKFVTYYGIGEISSIGMNILHGPPTLSGGCNGLNPNPAPFDAIITNFGTSTANNVNVTLNLGGTPLTIASGANPQNLGSIAGSGGGSVASWTVNFPPSSWGTTQCYSISVTWTGGGPVTENYCIDIPVPTEFSVSASAAVSLLCEGDCTGLVAVLDTSEIPDHFWTYTWFPPYFLSDPASPNPTACPETTITYGVQASDGVDCIDTSYVTIVVEPRPEVILRDTILCLGEAVTLIPEITPDGPGYTYSWSPGGATTREITVSPTSTQIYVLTVTSPTAGCIGFDDVTVYIDPEIIANAGFDDTICAGESVPIGGSPTAMGGDGDFTFYWEPTTSLDDPFLSNPLATPETTTTYVVTVTDGIGCVAYDTVTIYVDTPPSDLWLVSPPDGITGITPGPLTLEWNAASGTEIITYSVFMDGVLVASGLTETFFDTIANCTEFVEWFVVATNMCGTDTSDVWDYSVVPCDPPWAYLIEPFDSTWTSCDDQMIILIVNDDISIDTMSIRLTVNGITYDITNPRLWIEDDSVLIFEPSPLWNNGDIVVWSLDSLADELGTITVLRPRGVFFVDLASPVGWGYYPPPDTIISTSLPEISAWIADSLSGLHEPSVYISINGTYFYLSDIAMTHTWDALGIGMSLFVDISLTPIIGTHNDTFHICVGGHDSPDYCDPNEFEFCWNVYFDLEGPIADPPFDPDTETLINGLISSCADQGFCLPLYDTPISHGVVESTIVLGVNGILYGTDNPQVSYASDTLCFSPSADWAHAEVVEIELIAAEDAIGNALMGGPYAWSYSIDLLAPTISAISPVGPIGTLTPIVSWTLTDAPAGVDYDATLFGIDYIPAADTTWFDLSLPAFSHLGSGSYQVDVADIPFVLSGGDTVRICVRAWDAPDLCPPNQLDTCWKINVPTGGPVGTIIEPLDGTYSACDPQAILMTINDINGVVESSIIFAVNGIHYTTADPLLSFTEPNLVFNTPSGFFTDGEVVVCSLLAAEDTYGNFLEDTVVWSFTVDLSAPVVSSIVPAPVSVVGTLCPTVSFGLADALSGLDVDEVVVSVNGAVFLGVYSPDVTWAGGVFSFDLCDVITAVGGDLITICVHAEDMPDYCDPNVLDSCWSFSIEAGGPVGTIITPFNGIITSCDPQEIVISIFDSNGVDASTIELIVNGTSYYVGDAEISWAEPLLTFDGGAGFFTHGSVVNVSLVSADDLLGNPLTMPVSWSFTVDYEPPVLISITPTPSIPVDDISPLITIRLADVPAGIDYASAQLTITGLGVFTPSDAALNWFGDDLVFDPDLVPHSWIGGDSVRICLDITDLPDTAGYCDANDTVYCWWLLISRGGPIASIIEPLDGTFSACTLQQIIVTIIDSNGVNPTTIELIVDGTSYYVGDPEMDWTAPTLTWTPLADWVSGLVHVQLVSAEDSLGNALEAALDWWFTMDLEPPQFWGEIPAGGAVIADPEPVISIHIADILSGLDMDCLWITIDGGSPYLVDNPAVTWDGEVWTFSSATAGLWFPGGSTIDVCVHACDSPDYCPPNDSTHCWSFAIATGGPVATIIEPLDGTISACSLQSIIVTITDSDGVNESTIELEIDGVAFTTSDPQLSWSAPTLVFQPDTVWSEGAITVSLNSASDMLGNELSGAPIAWTFTVDLTPPDYSNFIPANTAQSYDWQQLISVDVTDAILGVELDSLEFEIDGVYRAGGPIVLRASTTGISWVDPTFTLDPTSVDASAFGITYPSPEDTLGTGICFPEFATITITARAFDQMPDYCDPNGSEVLWSFDILDDDTLGPTIFEFGPTYESTQNDVYLEARIADPSGVFAAVLIWDTDGELDSDFFGPVAMDSVATTYNSSDNSWLWRTTSPIGNFNAPTTVTYRITATDADFDFMNPADRTTAFADSICPILGGPVATYITPQPDQITACDNQAIVISLTDPDGVDPAPMVLRIDNELVPWGDSRLSYDPSAGELVFQPENGWWSDMQTVSVFLTLAEDSLGNPMWDTLSYSFLVDLEAPSYSNEMPPEWTMISNSQAVISIGISDNLAGVRADELAMRIDGVRYNLSDAGLSWDGVVLSFAPAAEGVEFVAGDTVCIRVYAGDDPDLCDPNRSEFDWCFVMEPKITCNLFPNPFTPNGDGINDFAVFDYPEMFSGDAELLIFDIRNKLVYKSNIGPVEEMAEFENRRWHGIDGTGNAVRPGLYLYIIEKDGEILCNGTVILQR